MSRSMHIMVLICGALIMFASSMGTAQADKINGNWCSDDGRTLNLDYSAVTTPGGSKVVGDYDAHHYQFTMPANERNGGAVVDIVLAGDDTIHVRYFIEPAGETALKPERWKRCSNSASCYKPTETWLNRMNV